MIWTPRVTVAAIIEQEHRFLLVEELIDGKTIFNQPAGHLDNGESLVQAVVRETLEETGRQFQPTAIIGLYRWRQVERDITFLRLCFTGEVVAYNPQQPLDDGILGTVWLTRDEVAARHSQLRSPLVLRCIDDYLAGDRFPLALYHDADL